MEHKNTRTTKWGPAGIIITEYSEGQEGWEVPFAKMAVDGDKLKVTFEGIVGENIMKTPVIKKKFPRTLQEEYVNLSVEMVGEMYNRFGRYLADIYVGVGGPLFISAAMDPSGNSLLYYVMRFEEDWASSDLDLMYNKETGGFTLDMPIHWPDLYLAK